MSEQRSAPLAPDLLRVRAENNPSTVPILVDGAPGLSFRDWDARSSAVAHGLLAQGVRRGDRVALFFSGMDWIDYAVAYLAVLKAGATAVHLNDELPGEELRRRWEQVEPVGVLHGVGGVPVRDVAAWTVPALDTAVASTPDVVIGPDDIADVLYTSGTTGPAKPFLNPHGNLAFGRGLGEVAKASFDAGSPLLMPMALGTAESAGTVGIFALTTTAPLVVCPPEDVERIGQLIEELKIGSVMLRPWLASRMAAAGVGDRYDLSTITTVGIASGALPAALARQVYAMAPNTRIMTAYGGGSEAVPANVRAIYDPQRPTCMGRPSPGTEVLVVDEQDRPVEAGVVGELWMRTAAPRRRYLDPAMDEQIHVDGWVRTRDLGRVNSDGEVFFFDRGSDAIRTPAGPVSSLEVEAILYEHPAVRQAAVVGVAGPDGTVIHAVVVFDPAERRPDVRAFAGDRLPPHAVPAVGHAVDALPRGSSGKVLKAQLREQLSQVAASAPVA